MIRGNLLKDADWGKENKEISGLIGISLWEYNFLINWNSIDISLFYYPVHVFPVVILTGQLPVIERTYEHKDINHFQTEY